jgi:hypothetical protein
MNTPNFVQFTRLPKKLLVVTKIDKSKSKRVVGLKVFTLLNQATGFTPKQDIAIKSLNVNQLKKMNKSYICFLREINASKIN